jgi:hypothetical protein
MLKNKHHYIPACYLCGFTEGGERTSRLWCAPKNNSKAYGTNPNDACAQRHYYKLDTLHNDSQYVEDWYANIIEPGIAEALKFIEDHKSLPSNEKMEFLLVLVATLYLRNPKHRKNIATPIERTAEVIMSMIADSPELYRSSAKKALKNGYISEIPEHHVMRSFVEDGQYTVNATRDALIESELKMLMPVLEMLAYRFWQLYIIPDELELEFVTSDHPFLLNYTGKNQKAYYGLGTKNTVVTVPLNRRAVLLGFLNKVKEGTYEADRILVGEVNSNVVMNCNKVFYSSKEEVVFSDGNSESWICNILNVGLYRDRDVHH